MANAYDIIVRLTSGPVPPSERRALIRDFAREFGWPSLSFAELPDKSDVSETHLLAGNGLEPLALISFLKHACSFPDLTFSEKTGLLGLSYNMLADWHIFVEKERVTFVFNRSAPLNPLVHPISRDNARALEYQVFGRLVEESRSEANFPRADAALIRTIRDWWQIFSQETGQAIPQKNLTALFNAILLLRTVEDHFRRRYPIRERLNPTPCFPEVWNTLPGRYLGERIRRHLSGLIRDGFPDNLLDDESLRVFDEADRHTLSAFLWDFHHCRFSPYDYDFSLIARYALGDVCEMYAAFLHLENHDDRNLFPSMGRGERERIFGEMSLPRVIPRFFAEYLRGQVAPRAWKDMRISDPVCGSGIFLRTFLESRFDPGEEPPGKKQIENIYDNLLGLDMDEGICQTCHLSLSLLHLCLTDRFPNFLNIFSAEAMECYGANPHLEAGFDAVMVNPPFRPFSKEDGYPAFVRLSVNMLRPGGHAFFVLPDTFLRDKAAGELRDFLLEAGRVRCVADIPGIRVFDEKGAHIILLIFRKNKEAKESAPKKPGFSEKPGFSHQAARPLTLIRCGEDAAFALGEALKGRHAETETHSIHDTEPDCLEAGEEWRLLSPNESAVLRKLASLPVLGDFFNIRRGYGGTEEGFVFPAQDIPRGEEKCFLPFVRDGEMEAYAPPAKTRHFFFYPRVGPRNAEEGEMRESFPETWKQLLSRKEALKNRRWARKNNGKWWHPRILQRPESLHSPKIIGPHAMLCPCFFLDSEGACLVSRSLLLSLKKNMAEKDRLRFFLAVLNSAPCRWHMALHSRKNRDGCMNLDVKSLRETPVPDPVGIPSRNMRRILRLVDRRIRVSGAEPQKTERAIDEEIFDAYGISQDERRCLERY